MIELTIPLVSVIVPTWGEAGVALTDRCLRSLIQAHKFIHPELIVVDDGSDEAVVAKLREVCVAHGAMLYHAEHNGGFAATCNIGLRHASGRNLFLVNNDVYFDGCPTLQLLVDTIDLLGSGVVGCKLLYPDRTIQHGGVMFVPMQGQAIPGYFDHFQRNQPEWSLPASTIRPSLVTGALLGIRDNMLQTVGLLDERFGMAAEDIAYQMDVMSAGQMVFYNGYVWAFHEEGKTRGRTPEEKTRLAPEAWAAEQRGLVKFFDIFQSMDWNRFSAR